MRWGLFLLLLAGCASNHVPREFPAYFPTRPANYLTSEHLAEALSLESEPILTLYDKKRLADIYTLELRNLKPGSERFQLVQSRLQVLAAELEEVESELKETQNTNQQNKEQSKDLNKPSIKLENPKLRKEYGVAYQLWNKDQNESALKKIQEVAANPEFKSKASRAEWFKILNLNFRVLLDLGDHLGATQIYQQIQENDSCAAETAEAGLRIALHWFAVGEGKKAHQILEGQCDPDESISSRIRRRYWMARFSESTPALAQPLYEEITRVRLPGYYFYLVAARLGRQIEFSPQTFAERSYLKSELRVGGEVNSLLLKAEERLQFSLRRDASTFLLRATQILKRETHLNIPCLLYVAHLFQASGNQLESMKIYAAITTYLQEEKTTPNTVPVDFLGEMFPRPHQPIVDWLSRQWGVDPDFIYALMRQESAFNPGATSVVDARGLMQLMPFLARSLSSDWKYGAYYADRLLFHAEENLKLSIYHLHQLQKTVPHMALIAAAYNAGVARSMSWWRRWGNLPLDVFIELIPIEETRNYVKLVIRNYIHYRALRSGGTVDPGIVAFQMPPMAG